MAHTAATATRAQQVDYIQIDSEMPITENVYICFRPNIFTLCDVGWQTVPRALWSRHKMPSDCMRRQRRPDRYKYLTNNWHLIFG